MQYPEKPERREDVAACVDATLAAAQEDGMEWDEAVYAAFQHCRLPGVRAINAEAFSGVVNRPGIQYPTMPGVGHPVAVEVTKEFLEAVAKASPSEVPINLLHDGRDRDAVVGRAVARMEGDALVADYYLDEAAPNGAVVEALVNAAIAKGEPLQVSFEVEDLEFDEDPSEVIAKGGTLRPVRGVMGAVSILPGVEGACGSDCTIGSLAACKSGGSCGDDCCGPSLRIAGTLTPTGKSDTLKNDGQPTLPRRNMTSNEDASVLEAKINTLEAELTTEREARMKAEQEVKELRDTMNDADGDMTPEAAAKIAELEEQVATLVKVQEAREEEARVALVEETKEAAPEGFDVDVEAPTEVLVAQLKAFRAVKEAPKTKKAPAMRLHAAKEGSVDDQSDVARILASRIKAGRDLPLAFQRNGGVRLTKEEVA